MYQSGDCTTKVQVDCRPRAANFKMPKPFPMWGMDDRLATDITMPGIKRTTLLIIIVL